MQASELLSPGICVICESGVEGIDHFDTNYNLELDTMIYLSGRKYLCEICFGQAAEYFGYEAGNQIENAEAVKEQVKAELKALYDHLETAREEAMAKFREIDAIPTRPRGRPRKHPLPEAADV